MFEQQDGNFNLVRLHDDARTKLLGGLKIVAEAVGSTIGPRGRCVLIQTPGTTPIVTKDGVSVAKAIHLRDPAQRAGAELIKEAASRTADVAGDGTTTSTILAYAMVKEGMKAMDRSFNPAGVKRGIDAAIAHASKTIDALAVSVDTGATSLKQIATISANGDEFIGDLIAKAVTKVGKDGIVAVDDAKGSATALEFVEGMQIPSGFMNSYFITHPEKMQAVLENCYVLLCDQKISSSRDMIPVLETVQKSGRALLIVAEDIEGEALQMLIINKMKNILKIAAIKAPGWGNARRELLNDLSALTGANIVSPATGLELTKVQATDLGEAKKATVDKQSTVVVATGATEEKVLARVKVLQQQLDDASLAGDDRAGLLERIGKMTAGAAIIKVGGLTEVEVREKRDRIDDAICATRAALAEGVVPGGGIALVRVSIALESVKSQDDSEAQGIKIVRNACLAPLKKIAENAGVSGDVTVATIRDANGGQFHGFDAAKNCYCNMLDAGIIDPALVVKTALANAASVAGIFLTLDAAVLEDVGQ